MIKKVILAAFVSSITSMIVFFLVADLLGNQIILKASYCASENLWRTPVLLTKNTNQLVKYFGAFFLTNLVWAYIFSLRQNAFSGTGVQKGITFFFLFWIISIPICFWSWIFIPYSKKVLLFNVFVYYLVLFLTTGAVIGKVCSEE